MYQFADVKESHFHLLQKSRKHSYYVSEVKSILKNKSGVGYSVDHASDYTVVNGV